MSVIAPGQFIIHSAYDKVDVSIIQLFRMNVDMWTIWRNELVVLRLDLQ